jgi:hypothetical protein
MCSCHRFGAAPAQQGNVGMMPPSDSSDEEDDDQEEKAPNGKQDLKTSATV